jgi:hypothetical protein
MAVERAYGGGTSDGQPERGRGRSEPAADTAIERAELAELRSRTEYYEVLRATVSGPDQADGTRRAERSGWDAIDVADRPDLDALRVTPERQVHILDGDSAGGGHRHGTGKPGKTEFPANWDDGKVIDALLDVARRPDQAPGHQEWNGRWVARGTRDDVEIVVVIAPDARIWSGWPLPGGAGVVKNPEGT